MAEIIDTKEYPPFVLRRKRAVAKCLDIKGREHFGLGDAQHVWIHYALVPIASGLTDSTTIRFIRGKYWFRIKVSREKALELLAKEPGTEEIRRLIGARYSLEAGPQPQSRMRCQHITTSRRCDREALPGWTTCKAHEDKGGPREESEDG